MHEKAEIEWAVCNVQMSSNVTADMETGLHGGRPIYITLLHAQGLLIAWDEHKGAFPHLDA